VGERRQQLTEWVRERIGTQTFEMQPASGDASFRRYFRVTYDGTRLIAMDSPPDKEKNAEFIQVAQLFQTAGLQVPHILEQDMTRGFLLLTDLGQRQYLPELNEQTVERLYGDALSALMVLQVCLHEADLPAYDATLLQQEMALFSDWYLPKEQGIQLTQDQQATLAATYAVLTESALAQPVVCVHRDYHSRNLMICEGHTPGILDFQDAVMGPITYDLVSLLKDCYIAWPRHQVEDWVKGYHVLALQSGLLQTDDLAQFQQWFDWMGVQRHLKAIGIFARLNHRDGKPGYLKDIPRTMAYVLDVSQRYPELQPFYALLQTLGEA